MWPGQQNPDGGQHPHQPHHPQPGPQGAPGGPQQPWNIPTQTAGTPVPAPRRRDTATVVAVAVAAVVVVAAAVTGYVLLGGDGDSDGKARPPAPTGSSAPATEGARTGGGEQATVPGWRTVTNPKTGIVFDVPPAWGLKPVSWVSFVMEDGDLEERPLIGFSAPAVLKEKWCVSDADFDGSPEENWLAAAGSRAERGARTLEDAARDNASLWVYGAHAQPDRDKVTRGPAKPYTTASGIRGSVATAASAGVAKKGKCDTDGKATTFAFKNAKGDIVSWTFIGAKGVDDEVPDATVAKILSSVRLAGG